MLRIEAKTRLSQDEVMKKALQYFTAHRMELLEQSADSAAFAGAGGGVSFITRKAAGLTSIELVSQEWDKQVEDFLELLPEKVTEKSKGTN